MKLRDEIGKQTRLIKEKFNTIYESNYLTVSELEKKGVISSSLHRIFKKEESKQNRTNRRHDINILKYWLGFDDHQKLTNALQEWNQSYNNPDLNVEGVSNEEKNRRLLLIRDQLMSMPDEDVAFTERAIFNSSISFRQRWILYLRYVPSISSSSI